MIRSILHLIDTGGPGGAETIYLNLVSGLDPTRWRATAVVPEKDWLWSALERAGVEPVLLPSAGSFDWGYLTGIVGLCRARGIDLIQTHLLGSAVYGTMAATALGLPLAATFHGRKDVEESGYRSAKFRILRRRRNRLVFVSRNLKQWFIEQLRVRPAQADVVRNGIDCEVFRPRRNEAVRSELGAAPGDLLIGAVGNLRTPKDYPTFLRAAAKLAQRSARYRFVIVGARDDRIARQLETLRAELGLEGRLRFAGFREDIHQVMNALDVYVLSSSSEGFSLTTVQAMASGVPVVATRSGGPEEIVTDGESGRLVPVKDAGALAEAVHALVEDEHARTSFATAARERALQEFSIERMVSDYDKLYTRALGGS